MPVPHVQSLHTRPFRALAGAMFLLLASGTIVSAHADLVASQPSDGSIVSATPPEIVLTFTEPLKTNSSIELVGPAGSIASAGPATEDPLSMRLVPPRLVAGVYSVRWTAATDDGHIERGSISFTVVEPTAPPPTATPAPTPSTAPATGPLSPTPLPPTGSPTASPTAPPGSGDGATSDAVVAIGGVALVIGAATLLLVRRGRRS